MRPWQHLGVDSVGDTDALPDNCRLRQISVCRSSCSPVPTNEKGSDCIDCETSGSTTLPQVSICLVEPAGRGVAIYDLAALCPYAMRPAARATDDHISSNFDSRE